MYRAVECDGGCVVRQPTKRQIDVLQLLAKDYTPKEVSCVTGLSVLSVYAACEEIKDKLDLNTTGACLVESLRRGWIV